MKSSEVITIILGIIAILVSIVGVVIAFFAWLSPFNPNGTSPLAPKNPSATTHNIVATPKNTTVPIIMPTTAPIIIFPTKPTSVISNVEFASSDGSLNSLFTWHEGDSSANSYDITSSNSVTISAISNTNQWGDVNSAPLILFPISGDFIAQVRLDVNPQQNLQGAGFGLLSMSNRKTWIRVERHNYENLQRVTANIMNNGQLVPGFTENTARYSGETVYFKIQRKGSLFSIWYSPDNNQWKYLFQDVSFDVPNNAEIYFYGASIANTGITTQFSDFRVGQ